MTTKSRLIVGALCSALLGAGTACSSSGSSKNASATTTSSVPPPKAAAPAVGISTIGVTRATEQRCDPIGASCMLPFPNDHFTTADPSTPTRRRLALATASMPANKDGVHIDVTDQNRADGWSPGSVMMAQFRGLDATKSKLPSLVDTKHSLDGNSSIVVVDATSGERHPFWSELDANADPGQTPLLMIHPASNFADGHRIVVGIRFLVDTSGKPIAPSPAFAAYRDGQRTTDAAFESRRPAMDRNFAALEQVGVHRSDLQLAWDFTVASTQSLTGRMIAMRDDAFTRLGQAAPSFTVATTTENPNEFVRRRVEGTFETPLYLTDGGKPGGRLVLDTNGRPQRQSGTFTSPFVCNLPAASATTPARMAIYGHGLLGDLTEANGDLTKKMGANHDIAYCATNWAGMSDADIGNAVAALKDLSVFPSIPDRLQQGILANLFLGRLMKHPKGFAANKAFRFAGKPALDNNELYYDGNSQGAILGGAFTAVAQDFTRATLGEAGMNYALLLDRSVDFDEYLQVMKPAYPKRYDRIIGLAVAQLLWDRGETDGYANHVTSEPLPGTPKHEVLLLGAVGDHQVTEYSLRVEAATMHVPVHLPLAAAGRVVERDPTWLLTPITTYPHPGSAYVLWDTGSPRSPEKNVPARPGHDPHDDTPNIPAVQDLKSQFWHPDGAIRDVCAAKACTAPIPPENA
ncbi:MAG: hypothetical protein QOI08_3624 [Actinomycetota bacterium]|nr:hypothetical protein [Actinomycetota bacterium]